MKKRHCRCAGADSCCIDTSYENPPRRAIDFVNRAVYFPQACCLGTRGDVVGDGTDADPADLAMLVDALFRCADICLPCPAEANVNGQGPYYNGVDLAYLVDYLFSGGPAPVYCEPD